MLLIAATKIHNFHSCLFLALDMLTDSKGTHKFSYRQILSKKSVESLAIPYIYCTFAAIFKNREKFVTIRVTGPSATA